MVYLPLEFLLESLFASVVFLTCERSNLLDWENLINLIYPFYPSSFSSFDFPHYFGCDLVYFTSSRYLFISSFYHFYDFNRFYHCCLSSSSFSCYSYHCHCRYSFSQSSQVLSWPSLPFLLPLQQSLVLKVRLLTQSQRFSIFAKVCGWKCPIC